MATKLRSVSEDTADLTSEDESSVHVTIDGRPLVDMGIDNVYDRYEDTARRIVRAVRKVKDLPYDMVPVEVANGVNYNILEEIPSLINGFHIQKFVINNRLFITNISGGNPHQGGVNFITSQANAWNTANGNRFQVYSDASAKFGADKSGAPDLKINIRKKYRPANENPSVVIVELEVGNRSINRMRQNFAHYFSDPFVISVVGIKTFGPVDRPVERMAAVQWTRVQGGAIIVESVKDFGINPISVEAKHFFSAALDPLEVNHPQPLPPVNMALWDAAGNRCVPVPEEAAHYLEEAMDWIVDRDTHDELYAGSITPTMTFRGIDLVTVLNVPGPNPVVLNDFVLNLGAILYGVAGGV